MFRLKKSKTLFLRHIINLQEEIKTLDSQAQQLYEIFVRKINIDINDSTEALNVIEMVSVNSWLLVNFNRIKLWNLCGWVKNKPFFMLF